MTLAQEATIGVTGKVLHRSSPEREWLQRLRAVTLVLEELPFGGVARTGKLGTPTRKLLWFTNYRVTEHWQGQLEAAPLAMTSAAPER
ncbi:hypothetical protein [Halochromatium roseum]|uniref:hypothetical protein n=1 Tax=Halochromatium roseum TaxID=391920 RepID=UPI001912ED10|nr:hypothetical protein [Halochromatium roseum]